MGLFFPANTSKQKLSVWVVCTLPERVFPNRLCPIVAPFLTGSSCPMTKLESKFSSSPKGLTPSQIGVILRDSHGVAQVRHVTGNKILRILKSKGLAPDLPEDIYYLIKKAVSIRKHLERNRKDKDSKFRLILVESRIRRLARYYKIKGVLPPTFKYESSTASTLVA